MADQRDGTTCWQVQSDPVQKAAARDIHSQIVDVKQAHLPDLISSQISQGAPISDAKRPSGNS